ncbi:MAG: DUF4215 domain-containing protein [Nanoarchaeota archaeon]|nr:DUF4215 domain-containing protein [Nanoarchaeota archaeon]
MGGADLIVNFDRDLNISDNLIYVDNLNLSGIDKSANLSIYGITFADPEIYHNGALCTDCTLISYSGGVYKFKVDSFSGVYWLSESFVPPVCGNGVVETGEQCDDGNTISGDGCSSTCQIEGGGGGGGGGGVPPPINITPPTTGTEEYDFFVNPDFFEITMNKGTYYQRTINVTNNGSNSITISIGVEGLQSFIFPEVRTISLGPGESRIVRFDIYVSNSRAADVYVGRIRFVATQVQKETRAILQVNEREALFDIRTEVLKKYIPPGGRVRANVTLINKGDLRNFDVSLEYKVIDFDRNEYTLKKEDFAIFQSYSDIFFLDLPENISLGDYLFYTQVSYRDVNASSYDTFTVEVVSTFSWFLLILILLLAMYLAYRIYEHKKKSVIFKEVTKKKEKEKSEKIKKELPSEVPKLPDKI